MMSGDHVTDFPGNPNEINSTNKRTAGDISGAGGKVTIHAQLHDFLFPVAEREEASETNLSVFSSDRVDHWQFSPRSVWTSLAALVSGNNKKETFLSFFLVSLSLLSVSLCIQ